MTHVFDEGDMSNFLIDDSFIAMDDWFTFVHLFIS